MFWCKLFQIFVLGLNKPQTRNIIIIYFEPLRLKNGRPPLDILYCLGTNLSLTPLSGKQEGIGAKFTEQRLSSCNSAEFPRITGSFYSPLHQKGVFLRCLHGMWFLASSGPLGLAVFFTHTLGIDVQGCSFSLLHLLGRDLALSLVLADGGSFLFSASQRLLLRTNPPRVLLAVQGYLASWLDLLPLLPWLVGSESLLAMAPRELVPAKPLLFFSFLLGFQFCPFPLVAHTLFFLSSTQAGFLCFSGLWGSSWATRTLE